MRKCARIQGFNVDLMSFDEVIRTLLSAISDEKNIHIVTVNPEIVQSAKRNNELGEIINDAEIVTPDGIGIKIALKLKGIEQEQITGIDLTKEMLKICASEKIKVAIAGAKRDNLELAIKNIEDTYEGIQIVYAHDGYFTDFEPIIREIINSGAKFFICAMGSPKQEFFISELKKQARGIVMIGAGGTIDVLSGKVSLAPPIFRKTGLEWLYRTIKQPKRFKRIFPALPIFFFQSIIDGICNKN